MKSDRSGSRPGRAEPPHSDLPLSLNVPRVTKTGSAASDPAWKELQVGMCRSTQAPRPKPAPVPIGREGLEGATCCCGERIGTHLLNGSSNDRGCRPARRMISDPLALSPEAPQTSRRAHDVCRAPGVNVWLRRQPRGPAGSHRRHEWANGFAPSANQTLEPGMHAEAHLADFLVPAGHSLQRLKRLRCREPPVDVWNMNLETVQRISRQRAFFAAVSVKCSRNSATNSRKSFANSMAPTDVLSL